MQKMMNSLGLDRVTWFKRRVQASFDEDEDEHFQTV